MDVDYIHMWCATCGFVTLKRDDVTITANLDTDQYEFQGYCLKCSNQIFNSRPMNKG